MFLFSFPSSSFFLLSPFFHSSILVRNHLSLSLSFFFLLSPPLLLPSQFLYAPILIFQFLSANYVYSTNENAFAIAGIIQVPSFSSLPPSSLSPPPLSFSLSLSLSRLFAGPPNSLVMASSKEEPLLFSITFFKPSFKLLSLCGWSCCLRWDIERSCKRS